MAQSAGHCSHVTDESLKYVPSRHVSQKLLINTTFIDILQELQYVALSQTVQPFGHISQSIDNSSK